MNPKVTVTQLSQDRIRPQIPTCPTERRVSVHVFCFAVGSGFQQQLNGFFRSEGGGTMERRFGFGAAIAHEATGFYVRIGFGVGIRASRQQNSDDLFVGKTISFAQRRVERGFCGVGQRVIHIRAAFDQKLTQPPMPMKCRAVQIEIVSEQGQ